MGNTALRAAIGSLALLAIMASALFIPAWTLNYRQAWVFLAVFFGSSFAITLYLMKNDPQLLERRITVGPIEEKEPSQKIIQLIASCTFLLLLIVPALDHRFGWSAVTLAMNVAGDVLVALGFLIVFLVFKENTYARATIDVVSDQRVISSGPYAWVRHPMYIGALILLLGTPLALGSWWGALMIFPFTSVLIWRLLDEERVLARDLPGYVEYEKIVRYRLVPAVW